MKCVYCDKKVGRKSSFCSYCGKEITEEQKNVQKNEITVGSVFKKIGKGIWFVISSIGYIIGTIFAFNFICDLFSGDKKKK